MTARPNIAVLGAGLSGCIAALRLAEEGCAVSVFDRCSSPISCASLHNEGKLHLGYVYGADTTHQTHELMAEGSLSFGTIIEQVTGVSADECGRSAPFLYAVPTCSQLSYSDQLVHFDRVDRCVESLLAHRQLPAHSFRRHQPLTDVELRRWFDCDRVEGAIQTWEYSVDTARVAEILRDRVLGSSGIDFCGETDVLGAKANGISYTVSVRDGHEEWRDHVFDGVVNCLWQDRLRVDRSVGIEERGTWLIRYKAAITATTLAVGDAEHPSITLVTGPYGDFVSHASGDVYLSWYPSCLLDQAPGHTFDFDEAEARITNADTTQIVDESFSAMASFVPQLESLRKRLGSIHVGGGYIVARGCTDITDPQSGLHERHQIGPQESGAWISLDTGKYCTAPMFGLRAAELLIRNLSIE